ncbi:MAG: SDR family NAD(P)-dependent oxidoreductase [Planctomycetota bacterium]|nr:SDR family NAD(P)-dependent oxidoreductase [Planctomycetota bacterium]
MPPRKTAIVTGASSGIGLAACLMLAREGFDLTLVARRPGPLEEAAAAVRRQTPAAQSLVIPIDLNGAEAPATVVAQTLARFGRVDALINSAGSAPLMPIAQVTPESWRACVDANLSYVVLMTAAAWPAFERQRSGVVVNLSSMASIDPFPGFAVYAAAKIGLNMFTFCTAREGEPIGLRAVAIAPGCVETPMLRQNFGTDMVPKEKALAPEAVAQVAVDCVLGRRAFKPGETIVVPSP